jgi:hypothetical protein
LAAPGRVRLEAPDQEAEGDAKSEHGRHSRELPTAVQAKACRQAQIPERLVEGVGLLDTELGSELPLLVGPVDVRVPELHGAAS